MLLALKSLFLSPVSSGFPLKSEGREGVQDVIMRAAIIIFILSATICRGQDYPYKNLVFEGAGIRGIAYAGVLEEFEKVQLLEHVKKVGGTSAGAIIALTISLGYSSAEIKEIIYNTDFNKFNDGGFIFFGGIHRMKKHYGWYRGDKFSRWVEAVINTKTKNSEITFAELHHKGYRDLYIMATSLNRQKLLTFSYETYPNMKVKDAIRVSMSIPLYFEAVFIDSSGTVIKKPGNRNDVDLVIDGGITGNYPIELFDSIVVDASGKKVRKANPETIGVRIDSDSQIGYDQVTQELAPLKISDFNEYMQAFYIFVLENLNRNKLVREDWERTISVSSVNIGPQVKKLSPGQKESLINSGRKSAVEFIGKMK